MLWENQTVLKECRARNRVSLVTGVTCQGKNGFSAGKSENISETGLLVRSPQSFPLDSELETHFVMPGDFDEVIAIQTKARVAWVSPGTFMGIQFLGLNEEWRKAIAEFVYRQRPSF